MVGSLKKSQGHRLPYLMIIALASIGFLIIIPVSSAETLKVISNTDRCVYQPKTRMDYCKTVYELCDPFLDMQKVDFRFKTEDDKTLKLSITELSSYFYSSKPSRTNCREITIEGYKNPYKNIDNVLCYGLNCHEEFIWWNTSFLSKFNITASTNSGEVTMPLLLNDSLVDIGITDQYVWCNYTINTTKQVVGYFYFTDVSLYQCVDRTETVAVEMDVDQGNGTNLNFTYEDDVLFVQHMNDGTKDSSSYSKTGVVTGSLTDAVGQIATAQTFSNDFITVTSDNGPTGVSAFTISVWFKTIGASGTLVFLGQTVSTKSYRLSVAASKLLLSGYGPGGLGLSTAESVDDGDWHQGVAVYFANDTGFLYLDGEFKVSGSPGTSMDLDGVDITVGSHRGGAADKFGGEMDEVRIWNRSLSGDEIRAMYENQNGTFGITEFGVLENLIVNASVNHFDIDVPTFLITSQQYQTIVNDTFTLVNPLNLIIKSSGEAMKDGGGAATSIVAARLIFNNVTLFDENIRSVAGMFDRGVFTFPMANVTGPGGINNLLLQMKRTGNDDIIISDFSFHIDTDTSDNDQNISFSLDNRIVNYTSTTFVNIANFSISKTTSSLVLIDVDHRLESTSNNIAANCYLESEQTAERTVTYSRWLQFSGNVGSSGINHRSLNSVNGNETWLLFCRSTNNNLMLNNITVYIMNQQDDINDTINGFQNSTSISGLTGSGNIILSSNHRTVVGTQLELTTTIIMQSTSGSQQGVDSPFFTVRTNDSVCNLTVQRSLVSNSDIGTAKMYLNCQGLTPGLLGTYEVSVDVSGGNTLNILNVSQSAYESNPQTVIEGVVPPIVVITSPSNGSVLSEVAGIITNVIDISRTGWSSEVTVLNSTGVTVLVILNETSFGNVSATSFDTRVLVNGNYTISWAVSNNAGSNSDNVTIIITNIQIPAPPTIVFCANGDLLLTRDSTRTDSNGNITIEVIDRITFCHYGCSNVTLSAWGNPGCIESDFSLSLILIAIVLISVLSIRRIL